MIIDALRKRVLTVSLGLVSVAAASALAASPAHADPDGAEAAVWWTFKGSGYGTCLTAGDTQVAFATACNGGPHQQWDWIHDSNGEPSPQLMNRATGRCLATDNASGLNAVWTSTCAWGNGQRFSYDYATGNLNSVYGTKVRAESDGAVRAGSSFYYWYASH
ncbi:hypothetical protein ABGB18_07165 [Nonomuraea sp. B12E4]|uniref:RICIN domain-containing protein n=1 Tax=Nonomuraea sp. B12E4 TaxID=3153564 RepID=UPI00325F230C